MIENETAGASKVAEMVDESQPTQELSSTPDDTSQHTDDTSEGTDDTQESPSEQPDDSQNGAGPALVEPARDPAAEATSNIRAATKGQHAEKNDDDDLSPSSMCSLTWSRRLVRSSCHRLTTCST